MHKTKLRVGDKVKVIAGKYATAAVSEGEILTLDKKNNRAIVRGINVMKKHQKADVNSPEGGIVEKQKSVHLSNLLLVDPKTGAPTRIGYKDEAGQKVRFAKKSGTVL